MASGFNAARRRVLGVGWGVGWGSLAPDLARAGDAQGIAARLRHGGAVLAFRHALAPGTFDPPGFVLSDCRTQRNLDEVGRRQADRIGAWFRAEGLQPAVVRSSPWCRCLETARRAFGAEVVQTWAALGSPVGTAEQAYPAHQAQLRQTLRERADRPGFEVWVTHQFVLRDLVGVAVDSAEALLLQSPGPGSRQDAAPWVRGHWRLPG